MATLARTNFSRDVQPKGLLNRRISRSLKESRVTNRHQKFGQLGLAVLALVSLVGLSGCNKGNGKEAEKAAPALMISPEDVVKLSNNALASGPSITGSVEPERRADLRAEVSAVVLAVLKENGDPVQARRPAGATRSDLDPRQPHVRARPRARGRAGLRTGAAPVRAHDQAARDRRGVDAAARRCRGPAQYRAERSRSGAHARGDRAPAARAHRGARALRRHRQRSQGFGRRHAQVGKELLKVIDPASLRFEGLVSADSIGEVAAGPARAASASTASTDRISTGKVTRVNPAANATTRQVEVLVGFDDAKQQPDVAGLYAEGRVETAAARSAHSAAASLVREGDNAFAWRVKDGKLQKVKLTLGERDARSGEYVVRDGLAEGDKVLRYPTSTLKDGQAGELAAEAKPA